MQFRNLKMSFFVANLIYVQRGVNSTRNTQRPANKTPPLNPYQETKNPSLRIRGKKHPRGLPPTRISGDLIKKIQTHSNAEIHKGPCSMDFDCKTVFAILVLQYFSQCQMRRPGYVHLIRNPKAGTAKAWLSMGFGHRSKPACATPFTKHS
jgi:hypothetical protein